MIYICIATYIVSFILCTLNEYITYKDWCEKYKEIATIGGFVKYNEIIFAFSFIPVMNTIVAILLSLNTIFDCIKDIEI